MTTISVSNSTELLSALSNASGGDTIELASGNYGSVDLNNLSFSSYVTITSADGNQGAVFSDIGINNSSYIRVDGVHVANPGNGGSGSKLVSITGSDHISVQNSEIHGLVDDIYNGHFGFYVDNGTSNIHLANNDIHDVKVGMAIYEADGLEVSGNMVDDTGSDGFKFSNITDYLIENNSHGGNFHPEPGAHIDFMQFEGSSGTSNGVIRGNVFLIGNLAGVQGIFMQSAPQTNVLIEDNIIYTSHLNAIKVNTESTGITIRDNTVLHAPDIYSHSYSPIIAPSSATVENNIWTGLNGGMSGSNLVVQYDNPSDKYYYGDLFVNADVGYGVTLEDLYALAGSAAEGKGAYSRLTELLTGEPAVPQSEPQPAPLPELQPEPIDGAVFSLIGNHEISGANDVLEFAHDQNLALSETTIALTFNADKTSGFRGLLSKAANDFDGGGNNFTSFIKNGTLFVRFQDGFETKVFKVGGIKANVDYDLQVSFGDGEVTATLNGEVFGQAAFDTSWETNIEFMQIGADGSRSNSSEAGFNHLFDGTISDVAIFDEVMPAQEIDGYFI